MGRGRQSERKVPVNNSSGGGATTTIRRGLLREEVEEAFRVWEKMHEG